MGPNHIVTNKRPIPLIQKDFASQNVEVGLAVRTYVSAPLKHELYHVEFPPHALWIF